jgi:hypothetical protein
MDLESFERLPSASLMRLVEVAMSATAFPELRKEALAITEAASRVLVGARMDMLVGSVMWMAGEREAGAAVLQRSAEDSEVGASAKAILAVLLATEGDADWQKWAPAEDASLDPLHREMLGVAREIAGQASGAGAAPQPLHAAGVATPLYKLPPGLAA